MVLTSVSGLPISIQKRSLRDFLEDASAPDGWVYSWAGPNDTTHRAFLQVERLEREYTIFWLGKCVGESIAGIAARAASDANDSMRNRGYARLGSWSVSMTYTQKGEAQKYDRVEPLPRNQITTPRLFDSIFQVLKPSVQALAFHVSLVSDDRPNPTSIEVWGDSVDSLRNDAEVGATANIPLASSFLQFFHNTSELAGVIPDLEDFFYKELLPHMESYCSR